MSLFVSASKFHLPGANLYPVAIIVLLPGQDYVAELRMCHDGSRQFASL